MIIVDSVIFMKRKREVKGGGAYGGDEPFRIDEPFRSSTISNDIYIRNIYEFCSTITESTILIYNN